jgi:hypothetical protein
MFKKHYDQDDVDQISKAEEVLASENTDDGRLVAVAKILLCIDYIIDHEANLKRGGIQPFVAGALGCLARDCAGEIKKIIQVEARESHKRADEKSQHAVAVPGGAN